MPQPSAVSPIHNPARAEPRADQPAGEHTPPLPDARRPEPILEFVRHRIDEPAQFPIKPGLTMLNNGSYGLTPRVVRDAQIELQRRMEADPVRFFKADLEDYCDDTRAAIASLTNTQPGDIALVPNGTFAVATVLNNLDLSPGDQILVSDHEYMATFNELGKVCRATGAGVEIAKIPFPAVSPEQVVESVVAKMNDRTRVVLLSHITSASALILPVKPIVRAARERGIATFLDGAHTPGQIELDIADLDPTWYAASCHKWLACPKGTGFIYTSPNHKDGFKPLALSCRVHETRPERDAYLCDFDYTGTNDYTGNLVIPVAIAHMGAQLPGGWSELRKRNHDLVIAGARIICDALEIKQQIPESMIASMVSIPLPGQCEPSNLLGEGLWDRLYLNHALQAPVWDLPGVHPRMTRISAQLYNTIEDYQRFAEALGEALRR